MNHRADLHRWLLTGLVAVLALAACGENADVRACSSRARVCVRDGRTELTSVGLFEERPDGQPFENGQKYQPVAEPRLLTIGRRSIESWDGQYKWATRFDVQTDLPSTGLLELVARAPWGVAALPQQARYATVAAIGPCLTIGDAYVPEHLVASILRSPDGELIIGGERSRLLPDGDVDRASAPSDLPEVELRWVEVGCGKFCGAAWEWAGDELWRSVALRVTPRGGGKPQQLLPGEHARFELDGRPYVFVLEHASLPSALPHAPIPAGEQLCGRAIWSLYQDGLIIDLKKAGEAPASGAAGATKQ